MYTIPMDIEHFSHQGYQVSVWIALVLSGLVVTLAALLGRGTLNLNGALLVDEPTDVTVIALTEPRLEEDVTISRIDFLRKEDKGQTKSVYAYHVVTSDEGNYLVRLGFNDETGKWSLIQFDRLHGEVTSSDGSAT